MKRRKRKGAATQDVQRAFVRGFVATALLAAVEARRSAAPTRPGAVVARGLKGAIALATGTVVAGGLQEQRIVGAAAAVLAGAVLLSATEAYLTPEHTEGAI